MGQTKAPDIEYHTDGTPWIKCSAASPQAERTAIVDGALCTVYHPDAKVIDMTDGSAGWDEEYECPHCRKTWWVECDG